MNDHVNLERNDSSRNINDIKKSNSSYNIKEDVSPLLVPEKKSFLRTTSFIIREQLNNIDANFGIRNMNNNIKGQPIETILNEIEKVPLKKTNNRNHICNNTTITHNGFRRLSSVINYIPEPKSPPTYRSTLLKRKTINDLLTLTLKPKIKIVQLSNLLNAEQVNLLLKDYPDIVEIEKKLGIIEMIDN